MIKSKLEELMKTLDLFDDVTKANHRIVYWKKILGVWVEKGTYKTPKDVDDYVKTHYADRLKDKDVMARMLGDSNEYEK